MDRFSIIQRQVFNQAVVDETISCAPDQCVCDETAKNEKQLLKRTDKIQVVLITIAAFIGTLTMKANMAIGNMSSDKRAAVISCSSKSDSSDDQLPGDRNRNTCSHQQGSLCESNNSKRKILKIHTC